VHETNTWLRKHAGGYAFLSRAERRAIIDFVLLWSLFESQVLNCNASADRMIAAIEKWHGADMIGPERIEKAWIHFVDRLTSDGEINYRLEGLRIARPTHREFLENAIVASPPEPDALTRHKALAIIIHRIRNNLLHGEKWAYGLADQDMNFRQSSQVLMVWMELNQANPYEPAPAN
jgi:hypothetical protein